MSHLSFAHNKIAVSFCDKFCEDLHEAVKEVEWWSFTATQALFHFCHIWHTDRADKIICLS